MEFNLYENFEDDLAANKKYEVFAAILLEKKFGFKHISFNDDKYYDIEMIKPNGQKVYFEVKKDNQTKNGNIIFEYRSYDKPSGIAATNADYWVQFFPLLGEIWIIRIPALLALIEVLNPEKCDDITQCWTWVKGGDGGNTKCYLWNREVFKHICKDDMIIVKAKIPVN